MYDFSGKVALITGAAGKRGVGRAIALRLAREGADLALIDLPPGQFRLTEDDRIEGWKGLESTVKEVQALGRQALALFADVADSQQVGQAVARALDKFGKIDILVNNAGIMGIRDVPIVDLPEDVWHRVLAVNLNGPYLLCRAVARHMVERGQGGKIVNVASISGLMAIRGGMGTYTASKFGLIGLTQTLALELGPHNINVNAICPGTIATEMGKGVPIRSLVRTQGLSIQEATEQVYADSIAVIPMRRVAQPEDIASLAAFLASDDARHLTGMAVNISGGQFLSRK